MQRGCRSVAAALLVPLLLTEPKSLTLPRYPANISTTLTVYRTEALANRLELTFPKSGGSPSVPLIQSAESLISPLLSAEKADDVNVVMEGIRAWAHDARNLLTVFMHLERISPEALESHQRAFYYQARFYRDHLLEQFAQLSQHHEKFSLEQNEHAVSLIYNDFEEIERYVNGLRSSLEKFVVRWHPNERNYLEKRRVIVKAIPELRLVFHVTRSVRNLIRDGDLIGTPQLINMVLVIGEVSSIIWPRRVFIAVEPGVKPIVWMDPDCAAEVLGNLVSNAMTRGHAHGMTFHLFKDGSQLGIEAIDDGTGIDLNIPGNIFDKKVSAVGSTGLGLYIVRQFVRAVGGWIWLENPGRSSNHPGAEFKMRLPVAPRPEILAHRRNANKIPTSA